MGWSHAGNTRQKYQHYYNDDSFDAMLVEMDGLAPAKTVGKNKELLRPKQCPNCSETNTPESRFCAKCKFVLSFDAFNETITDAESTKKRLADLEQKFERLVEFSERRSVSHELELRGLKGEGTNVPLTNEDVEDILRWEEYHDYMEEQYAQEQQRRYEEEQRRLYEKYLQQQEEE